METGISIGISIAALLISFFTPIASNYWQKRMNEKNLMAVYIDKTFSALLFDSLLVAREMISYNNNCLNGTDELVRVIKQMRKKTILFKRVDVNFYEKIYTLFHDFEDFMIMQEEKMANEDFVKFYGKMDEFIDEIITEISSKYLGKM